jgi:hypothetical protein
MEGPLDDFTNASPWWYSIHPTICKWEADGVDHPANRQRKRIRHVFTQVLQSELLRRYFSRDIRRMLVAVMIRASDEKVWQPPPTTWIIQRLFYPLSPEIQMRCQSYLASAEDNMVFLLVFSATNYVKAMDAFGDVKPDRLVIGKHIQDFTPYIFGNRTKAMLVVAGAMYFNTKGVLHFVHQHSHISWTLVFNDSFTVEKRIMYQ